ncbi:MAG: hypothetical protein V2I33_15490 [Kangiellaceae bacterium]|jgi:hypothetical protein|nr:hypothetical protein [Kangiellaceae bacterium]
MSFEHITMIIDPTFNSDGLHSTVKAIADRADCKITGIYCEPTEHVWPDYIDRSYDTDLQSLLAALPNESLLYRKLQVSTDRLTQICSQLSCESTIQVSTQSMTATLDYAAVQSDLVMLDSLYMANNSVARDRNLLSTVNKNYSNFLWVSDLVANDNFLNWPLTIVWDDDQSTISTIRKNLSLIQKFDYVYWLNASSNKSSIRQSNCQKWLARHGVTIEPYQTDIAMDGTVKEMIAALNYPTVIMSGLGKVSFSVFKGFHFKKEPLLRELELPIVMAA